MQPVVPLKVTGENSVIYFETKEQLRPITNPETNLPNIKKKKLESKI